MRPTLQRLFPRGLAAGRPMWLVGLIGWAVVGCAGPMPALQLVHLRAEAPAATPKAPANPSASDTQRDTPGAGHWQLVAVKLPDYLDRAEVLTRKGSAGLAPVSGVRWAEPLADAVPRALREDLALRLGPERVWGVPLPAGVIVHRQVRVDITGFEADEARSSVRLSARWTVADPAGGTARQGAAVVEQAVESGTADALITAYRAAISRLAARIATP